MRTGTLTRGAIYENFVCQEPYACGFTPCYYNPKKMGELDFVIGYGGKVLPLEIKNGKDYYRHSDPGNVLALKDYAADEAYVFALTNIEVKGKVVYYPIYMLMCLEKDVELAVSRAI